MKPILKYTAFLFLLTGNISFGMGRAPLGGGSFPVNTHAVGSAKSCTAKWINRMDGTQEVQALPPASELVDPSRDGTKLVFGSYIPTSLFNESDGNLRLVVWNGFPADQNGNIIPNFPKLAEAFIIPLVDFSTTLNGQFSIGISISYKGMYYNVSVQCQ